MTLPEYISLHATKPFEWGANDCCTFAIGWLGLCTGRDYLAGHKPWRSAREGMQKLRDLGGLSALFQKHLKQINPNMAHDGDHAIHQGAAHLFSGRHIVSVGESGLVFNERTLAEEGYTCQQ